MHGSLFVVFIVWIALSNLGLNTHAAEIKKISVQGYNPGECNYGSHGKLVLVKDRRDNDKLLVCVEENGVYLWKPTDGSSPTGEFFNPAYDCSDALNNNLKAKDGFYWIKLSGNVSRKAWCDMTTDGGGWLLIGRKKNAVTWTVPSNNKTVEPFGEPHWSSSFGDAPIVDFRVQVATQEDLSKTKAHWSFRLQNKRPLKNLLMLNEGGCGRLSPGIGNISYVKDLQSKEIVATKFRCSQFSSYHSKTDGFGWDMLNYCLEHPCSSGFAFHKKYPVQIDFSGAFSYSAAANTSGITHDSTSFVGCENHKCCACFGPIGGKRNYCGIECKAKNGGSVVKNVYTWFWVRSSLPKKVWNKCMEYKVTVGQGKVVWYKLYNGNTVPIMGRCDQGQTLLNDGIAVVPDSTAAQKVPPVPGFLEYRKDTKKLYIRSNETWNAIGEENKLKQEFTQLIKELKSQLESVNKTVVDMKGEIAIISKKSCADIYKSGERKDGIYIINPFDGLGSFRVWCDMQTDGGGWTVFQKREDSNLNFYRGWQDYKVGFGNFNGNFWLGLDKIHRLVKSRQNVLRVDLTDWNGDTSYAKYGTFSVASESDGYRLNIGSYSGNAGDSLNTYHNGMKFTTKDRDNDQLDGQNCAVTYQGAWWYKYCHYSNLNGLYLTSTSPKGINWYHWKHDRRSMKKTEMKMRPTRF